MLVERFEEEGLAVESRFIASQREPDNSDDGKLLKGESVGRVNKQQVGGR